MVKKATATTTSIKNILFFTKNSWPIAGRNTRFIYSYGTTEAGRSCWQWTMLLYQYKWHCTLVVSGLRIAKSWPWHNHYKKKLLLPSSNTLPSAWSNWKLFSLLALADQMIINTIYHYWIQNTQQHDWLSNYRRKDKYLYKIDWIFF